MKDSDKKLSRMFLDPN